ncbi:MAG: hypothetical protein ACHQ7N_16835 [Candidatus Methylomirabilales bacterium]
MEISAARRGHRVVMTDIFHACTENPPANTLLNELGDPLEVRAGDLFAPVNGDAFDVIATNSSQMPTAPDGNWDDLQSRANNGALDGWAVLDWIIHETPENFKLQGRLVSTLFGSLDLEGALEKHGLRAWARVSSLEKSNRSLTSRGSDWPTLGP